jgi:hypothetical protein
MEVWYRTRPQRPDARSVCSASCGQRVHSGARLAQKPGVAFLSASPSISKVLARRGPASGLGSTSSPVCRRSSGSSALWSAQRRQRSAQHPSPWHAAIDNGQYLHSHVLQVRFHAGSLALRSIPTQAAVSKEWRGHQRPRSFRASAEPT